MKLEEQVRIPPPVQPDALVPAPHAPPPLPSGTAPPAPRPAQAPAPSAAAEPVPAPHFELDIRPVGAVRRRIRKVHRSVAPLIIVVGYVSSAAIGLGLGYLVISGESWRRFATQFWEVFK